MSETPSKLTLKEFIEENQKLLSVVGVFAALGLLWKTVDRAPTLPWVSYLSFSAALVILWEVRRGYEWNRAAWSLRVFVYIFQGIIFVIAWNLVFNYPEHLETLLSGVLWFASTLLALNGSERIDSWVRRRD